MILHSQPQITSIEHDLVTRVLDSAMLSQAEMISTLEKQLAIYLNQTFSLFTGNGSQAQVLLLMALGVGTDSEVIVPSYVCNKVWKAVTACGATPVFAEMNDNWTVNLSHIKSLINRKTKAVILPHVYGINSYTDECKEFGVPVIEDICQSFGAAANGEITGSFADYAFTSFHGTKPVAAGEGGMLFTRDLELAKRILEIKTENPLFTSGNEMVAAIAMGVISRYPGILRRRAEIANKYHTEIPKELNGVFHSMASKSMNFRYLLRSNKDFETIKKHYLLAGIHVRKGVDNLNHREWNLPDEQFPVSTMLFNTTVSIPLLPQLTDAETDHVVQVTNDLFIKGIL